MDPQIPVPASLKSIQHFLKLSQEHDARDIVVAYWSRLYALQIGLKLSTHQPEETTLLVTIMDWLEKAKKENSENEAISAEVAAQAHIENYALKLFLYADKQDRSGNFGKNVVKAFYSSGILYDVLQTFGELTEEAVNNRKYAKWKAAYIHNCLKNGEMPVAGPMQADDDEGLGGGGEGESEENNDVTTPEEPTTAPDNEDDDQPPKPAPIDRSPPSTTPPTADEVLNNPSKLPSPPIDEEKPGGFEPYEPSAQPNPIYQIPAAPAPDVAITPDQMIKAQKYCKYAGSALNYDDVKTAIENLQKALTLLTTGHDG